MQIIIVIFPCCVVPTAALGSRTITQLLSKLPPSLQRDQQHCSLSPNSQRYQKLDEFPYLSTTKPLTFRPRQLSASKRGRRKRQDGQGQKRGSGENGHRRRPAPVAHDRTRSAGTRLAAASWCNLMALHTLFTCNAQRGSESPLGLAHF